MEHKCLAFSCWSFSVSALFAASFSCWDDVVWGFVGMGVRSGKSSGEEIGLRDGNESDLAIFWGDGLSSDCALLVCTI